MNIQFWVYACTHIFSCTQVLTYTYIYIHVYARRIRKMSRLLVLSLSVPISTDNLHCSDIRRSPSHHELCHLKMSKFRTNCCILYMAKSATDWCKHHSQTINMHNICWQRMHMYTVHYVSMRLWMSLSFSMGTVPAPYDHNNKHVDQNLYRKWELYTGVIALSGTTQRLVLHGATQRLVLHGARLWVCYFQ